MIPFNCSETHAQKSSISEVRPNILWITSEDNITYPGCFIDPIASTPSLNGLVEDFTVYDIDTDLETTMKLCEKQVELNGVALREVRRPTDIGHQTSVIRTNYKISTVLIALYMFSRWSQENYFMLESKNIPLNVAFGPRTWLMRKRTELSYL